MQPLALRAQNQRAIHVVVEGVVGLLAALVEANGPDVALLQLLYRTRDVRNFCYGQMLARSGGGLCDRASDCRCAALGDDNTVGSGGVGRAHEGAEVVRVFNAIENEDERILAALGADYVVEVAVLFRRSHGHDALMSRSPGHLVEFGAREEFYGHA